MNLKNLQNSQLRLLKEARLEAARRDFVKYIKQVMPSYNAQWFHNVITDKVQDLLERQQEAFKTGTFEGKKRLMILLPPQHGKSEILSRKFPVYALGRNPDLKIVAASHSASLARSFSRDVKRGIKESTEVFPNLMPTAEGTPGYINNADEFEVANHRGSYMAVGVGGSLIGRTADILIIDDPYKGLVEASSPAIQKKVAEWYTGVANPRTHNHSIQIIIMQRWVEDDLIGKLLLEQPNLWEVVMFPAIKEGKPTELDPREAEEALWPEKHGISKLREQEKLSKKNFKALYQQDPQPSTDSLIFGHAQIGEVTIDKTNNFYGLDFGFSNSETAVVELNIDLSKKIVYVKEVIYETGLTNQEIARKLKRSDYNNEFIYCDSAEPKSIQELKREGINARKAKKFPNSVLTQILYLQEFDIIIDKNSPHLIEERNKYQWQTDANGKPINKEVDANNHAFKAIMYAVYTHTKKTKIY